jgi:NitT/TauT family transport system substrate-binding protein
MPEDGIDLDIQEGRGSGVTVQAVGAKIDPVRPCRRRHVMRAGVQAAPRSTSTRRAAAEEPGRSWASPRRTSAPPDDLKGKTVATTPGDALSQIWPLFLKKTNLQATATCDRAGDAQTKLNAVISARPTCLLGLLDDQSHEDQGRHRQIRVPDHVRRLRASTRLVRHHRPSRHAEGNPDLVRRFMRAATLSAEAAEKNTGAAADAMLEADSKAGKKDTLTEGFEISTKLYRVTADQRPFHTNANAVKETVDLLVEYGGVDPAAKEKLASFFTTDFLPGKATN